MLCVSTDDVRVVSMRFVCRMAIAVSDTGLEHLLHLKQLPDLSVQETQVTADGVRKFHAACPDCVVHH